MTPLISVLMPCYNAEAFVGESITSILNQTYPRFELLVADDGSTDGTRAIIDSFADPRIRRLDRPAHLGYLKLMNFLFSRVSGDFFAFQDADDVSEPNRFERQLAFFAEHPEIHLCTTDYHRTDRDGRIRVTRRWPTDFEATRFDSSRTLQICKASIMARRDVLDIAPGYREFFDGMGGEDIDWLYRVIEQRPARHLSDVLYRYRMHYSACKSAQVSHAKYYVMDLVEMLRRQRLACGSDWLESGDHAALQSAITALEQPFAEDPSYVYRLRASDQVRFRRVFAAGGHASMAIARRPLHFENYRSFARNLSAIVSAAVKGHP